MARLRNPDSGCPWDIKQDFQSIVPHTLEETYEVVDAIERGDFGHLCEELGDLLFQVIFYAQMAKEQELFDFSEIIDALAAKLLKRHPHVFPDGVLQSERKAGLVPELSAIRNNWEQQKAKDRLDKGALGRLADIPLALPALSRSEKLQKRAANHGFDWPDYRPVLDKIDEELAELREAIEGDNEQHVEEELGDLIFACVNLGRHRGFNLESCLRRANQKFETRFRAMEVICENKGLDFEKLSLEGKNDLWLQVKRLEPPPPLANS
ncbi:MAG: nucleoside triphosphate pyrophosphohydrolase [Gammaproteobacteria bacterium]|nr:nucleoside triphosphate pyrophosphohydrolase [Gammaproteobacteria bacterium]MBQ0839786.1 nucleoside triphosphate pyrophosphohydrolase [Gammaproteobacteria bacterium]